MAIATSESAHDTASPRGFVAEVAQGEYMHSETIELGGAKIEYSLSRGKTDTVVLVNGSGGPLVSWFGIYEPLSDRYNVLAYNRPGIGTSTPAKSPQTATRMAEDLKRLLDSLLLTGQVILVGHSLGGFVVLQFALNFPQRVKAVVLLEPSTPWDILTKEKLPTGRKNADGELNFVRESAKNLERFDAFPQVPTYVGIGTKSSVLSWSFRSSFLERRENLKKLARLLAGSHLVEFSKSGHFPQITEPKRVIETVERAARDAS